MRAEKVREMLALGLGYFEQNALVGMHEHSAHAAEAEAAYAELEELEELAQLLAVPVTMLEDPPALAAFLRGALAGGPRGLILYDDRNLTLDEERLSVLELAVARAIRPGGRQL